MDAAQRSTICIFAKAPRAGHVKTRLAVSIGPEAAAELAAAFLWDTLAVAERAPSARVVVVLSGDAALLPTLEERVAVWPQGEGDLGARLERGLRRALSDAPRAIAIGTDSPGLGLATLVQALASLETHDAVVGPAEDGGFYLLGLNACPEGLLADVPWSSVDTRARTLTRLRRHGMSVDLLPAWFDVDVAADLHRLRALLDGGQVVAPATARVLGIRTPKTNP